MVTLSTARVAPSGAKGPPTVAGILRSARNDRLGGTFGKTRVPQTRYGRKEKGGADVDAFKHGVFSWCELMTTDVDGATQFYTELFGWTVEAVTNEANQGMQYHLVKVEGTEVGGIMAQPAQARGAPPCWGAYVTVDDVDATSRKAQELGGSVIVPLTDIPDVGRFCVIRDPQGAVISVITYSGEHHG